ncbi:hypothetical protein BDY19DRAFT_997131 [Irpex rosettiformis]|uniref:Uncharacterized protein n=1 Tax=Irpex rosettiformis TaxID=378272 RepID=A0ACB8TSM6_9APHY|nr:hypothetical protein BDY19DRAFT_997131 [Irpex rosettiformis]
MLHSDTVPEEIEEFNESMICWDPENRPAAQRVADDATGPEHVDEDYFSRPGDGNNLARFTGIPKTVPQPQGSPMMQIHPQFKHTPKQLPCGPTVKSTPKPDTLRLFGAAALKAELEEGGALVPESAIPAHLQMQFKPRPLRRSPGRPSRRRLGQPENEGIVVDLTSKASITSELWESVSVETLEGAEEWMEEIEEEIHWSAVPLK